MCVAIRVASRATQRTLPRNLDRQHGSAAGQNSSPRGKHFAGSQAWIRGAGTHSRFDAAGMPVAAFVLNDLALAPNSQHWRQAKVRQAAGRQSAVSAPALSVSVAESLARNAAPSQLSP